MTDGMNRSYARISNEFNVRISGTDNEFDTEDYEIKTSKSVNISASGLLIFTAEKLKVGSMVRVTFMKPHTIEFFRGTGRIIWTEERNDGLFRTAIEFTDLSRNDQKALDYYLRLAAG